MSVLSIFIISFEFVAFIISLIILSILCLQKNKNQKDKDILWIVFLGALLLISDCLAEFYKGNTSEFGYLTLPMPKVRGFLLPAKFVGRPVHFWLVAVQVMGMPLPILEQNI